MTLQDLAQLYTVTAPSGQKITLTEEEEADIVKDAIRERLMYGVNRKMEIERAGIGAIGNAIGFAVGGLLIGWLLGKGAKGS